ncbi:MAG: DNA topoisomerase VI subunit B [Candidatus Latescibacteria bacterium]|nr:DNA topoisomerase VI subunit B [Candidatus Latescibacterota bacterium]
MGQAQLKRVTRKEKHDGGGRKPAPKPVVRLTAHDLAARQREISVSEFFTKNRHLLGFDSPAKALLTTVKEAVDNALDACEEAGILPDLAIEIAEISETRYRVAVRDNGPGIVKAQVPKIFGQLLYGSKFHRLRQARGQQGIGISAAGMYGQLTTGKPIRIISKPGPAKPAHEFEIHIDTKRNQPVVASDREREWTEADPATGEKKPIDHGTRVELEIEATYKKGRHSVDGYVEQTAIANPHAEITYVAPDGEPHVYPRVAGELPKAPLEIKPHPHGVELGILLRMLHDTKARNLGSFLHTEFSRVSPAAAAEITSAAGLSAGLSPHKAARGQVEALYQAIQAAKLMAPPSNVLSPIDEELLLEGLKKQVTADFFAATSRSPAVYRGNPFLVEAALAYGGGQLPGDELITLLRFANRVPLLYQQSACAITKSVIQTAWKTYGIQHSRGALPTAPMVLMVHIASVWVPFTSESKEAVASYPEIMKEIRLALQDVGRKLGLYIRRGLREADAEKKRSYIEKYIPHIGIALQEILGIDDKRKEKVCTTLKDTLERSRTP